MQHPSQALLTHSENCRHAQSVHIARRHCDQLSTAQCTGPPCTQSAQYEKLKRENTRLQAEVERLEKEVLRQKALRCDCCCGFKWLHMLTREAFDVVPNDVELNACFSTS